MAYCRWPCDPDHICCANAILSCIAVSIMDSLDTTKQPQIAYHGWPRDSDHTCCINAMLSCIAVSIMDALDTKKPNAISLLGKELVVWRDDAGQWVCMDDQCSHRLAPLSGLTPAVYTG